MLTHPVLELVSPLITSSQSVPQEAIKALRFYQISDDVIRAVYAMRDGLLEPDTAKEAAAKYNITFDTSTPQVFSTTDVLELAIDPDVLAKVREACEMLSKPYVTRRADEADDARVDANIAAAIRNVYSCGGLEDIRYTKYGPKNAAMAAMIGMAKRILPKMHPEWATDPTATESIALTRMRKRAAERQEKHSAKLSSRKVELIKILTDYNLDFNSLESANATFADMKTDEEKAAFIELAKLTDPKLVKKVDGVLYLRKPRVLKQRVKGPTRMETGARRVMARLVKKYGYELCLSAISATQEPAE